MNAADTSTHAANATRGWWGLTRMLPRFWMPRPLSVQEVLYAGCVPGLLLMTIAWAFARLDAETLQQTHPQWLEPLRLMKILWCIFFSPCLVTLGLWIAGLTQPRDPTRMLQSDTERWLEHCVFMMREKHTLRQLDQACGLLLAGSGGFIIWRIIKFGSSWQDWAPELHLAGGAAVVLLLGALLKKNRFHPREQTFEVPNWFTDLASQFRHAGACATPHMTTVRDPAYEVVWPDDAPTFLYTFSPDLPEPIQPIGVHVGPEVTRLMSKLNEAAGGALFRQRDCDAAADMINPFEGPLDTIGLLEYLRLVAQIRTRARVARWDKRKLASAILAFVQREIEYVKDEASTGYPEYGRFPLQTLCERKGDCECKAILCCALLAYCGIDCALMIQEGHVLCGLRRPTGWLSWFHIWFTKKHAADYLFGESTDEGAKGEWLAPTDEQLNAVTKVVPVNAIDLASDV